MGGATRISIIPVGRPNRPGRKLGYVAPMLPMHYVVDGGTAYPKLSRQLELSHARFIEPPNLSDYIGRHAWVLVVGGVFWLRLYFQVLWAVIASNAVLVVNYLTRQQVPTKHILHYQAVFCDIAAWISTWVVWTKQVDIAPRDVASAIPAHSMFTPQLRLKSSLTCYRTVLTALSDRLKDHATLRALGRVAHLFTYPPIVPADKAVGYGCSATAFT